MSGVSQREVDPDGQGQRLDRWFRRHYPQVTQGRLEKMCRKGEIRVDGGRVKSSTRLEEGQTVRVPPLPDGAAPEREKRRTISDADARMMQGLVLYRDEHLVAINKPAGLPTQGGTGQDRHVDGLAQALNPEGARPKLVHRLDKDTSGVLLLALSGRAAAALAKSFNGRDTRKMYWAAVAGAPNPKMGTIRYGLVKAPGHGPHGAGEKMVTVHPNRLKETEGAKHATTDYAVIDAAAQRTAWVAMAPITGRTHQLRAHMEAIGHPIVGDGKYGTNRQENLGDGWGAQLGGDVSRKLHLHARSLSLPHPVTGAHLSFTAPLPEHMKRTWDLFGWMERDAPFDPFEEEF